MKTADKPLKTYKVMVEMPLNGTYRSYFMPFEYKPNKEYNEELQDSPSVDQQDGSFLLLKGFHSYFGNLAVCIDDTGKMNIWNRDGKGKWVATYSSISIIVECVLPQGTHYYVNENNEVISDRIIVTDKILRSKKPELLNTGFTFDGLFTFAERNNLFLTKSK